MRGIRNPCQMYGSCGAMLHERLYCPMRSAQAERNGYSAPPVEDMWPAWVTAIYHPDVSAKADLLPLGKVKR